jgi:flavorubredoxin
VDNVWRDIENTEKVIDTNQYMVKSGNPAILLDPGGIELFAPMLGAVLHHVPIDQLTDLCASHQDPDIISSLGLWDKAIANGVLHAPWLWAGFIRHFGMNNISYRAIPDEGGTIDLVACRLQLIPAHYLHTTFTLRENFICMTPQARILMSGDVGAALEAVNAPLYVEDFEELIPKMKVFYQRWMPSIRAKNDWVARVRKLDIGIMAPQHGRLFTGGNVTRFLDWFETLEVGAAIPRST